MQLFKRAVEASQQLKEQRSAHSEDSQIYDKHSSSMNNLAVVMESGRGVERDVQKAKELYLRAVETHENPIAMCNLAVLLKFGDTSAQNLEKAESLFSAVADLSVDLQSWPVLHSQLTEAQGVSAGEISEVCRVDVDEIDDCFTYVKLVDGGQ